MNHLRHTTGSAELNTGRAVLLEVTSRGGIIYEPAAVELKGTIRMKTQVTDGRQLGA